MGLGIPGTANHIATPVSRFLALLGVLQQPGKTREGMQALVTLLAPDTTVKVSPYCLRPVEVNRPLGFHDDDDFLLDGNTPLGDEAMDANSQLLVALTTENEQEVQGWKPDGLLYQDFLVMLRVYLGWRFRVKITLTTRTRLLAAPPLGEGPFWLGMNGVLGAEDEDLPDDIPRPLRPNWAITPDFSPRHHNKETDVLRTSLTNTARWLLPLLAFSLTGCGVTQGITDGTKSAFNAVFYKRLRCCTRISPRVRR